MKYIILILFLSISLFANNCPEELTSLAGEFSPSSVFATDRYAYLGDKNILKIYDIKDISNPSFISKIKLGDLIRQILSIDDLYCFCATNEGLKIVDISQKTNPKVVSVYSISYLTGLAYFNNVLYLCAINNGLIVLDVSNKKEPKFIKKLDIKPWNASVEGNLLYVAGSYIYIYSLTNPKDPEFISKSENIHAENLKVKGNLIYAACWDYPFAVVDVNDLSNPVVIYKDFKYSEPACAWRSIVLIKDVAIVGGVCAGWIYDIYNSNSIFHSGTIPENISDLYVRGDYIFAAVYPENLFKIYDGSNCLNENFVPNPSFTYTPENPSTAEPVNFNGYSYPLPTSWEWDFGDGSKSEVEDPYNIYLRGGEYEVKLKVKNPAGSKEISKKINVFSGIEAPPFEQSGEYKYLIPAVAYTKGANGTFWQSDLEIINPEKNNEDAEVNIYYIPQGEIEQGEENCNYLGFYAGKIPKRGEIRLKNILNKIFNEEKAGALWITSNVEIILSSRTYNTGGGKGTYGQYVPPVEEEKINQVTNYWILPGVINNENYRTNIGFVNTTNKQIIISDEPYPGPSPENIEFHLPPCSWNQFPLFTYSDFENYYDLFGFQISGVYIYSSIIDNRTGDAIFVPSVPIP